MGQPFDISPSGSPASPAKAREQFQPLTRGATEGAGRGNPLKNLPAAFTVTKPEIKRREPAGGDAFEPPFKVSFGTRSGDPALIASPGTIGIYSHAETVELNPADGEWWFVVSVTLNNTTGAITGTTATWEASVPANTSTTAYHPMAWLELSGGALIGSPEQYNYGPMHIIQKGGIANIWEPVLI